jgi:hypothetical protein
MSLYVENLRLGELYQTLPAPARDAKEARVATTATARIFQRSMGSSSGEDDGGSNLIPLLGDFQVL